MAASLVDGSLALFDFGSLGFKGCCGGGVSAVSTASVRQAPSAWSCQGDVFWVQCLFHVTMSHVPPLSPLEDTLKSLSRFSCDVKPLAGCLCPGACMLTGMRVGACACECVL